jgi:NADH dehydrogenase
LSLVDVEGTRQVAQAAAQAGIERFYYLSHLGADRASAYPVFRAKALAESAIIHSGVPYTIFRSAAIFGQGDALFSGLVRLMRMLPFAFLMPGDGNHLIQPIWVEDLAACLLMSLENNSGENQMNSIGGAEYLSLRQVVKIIEQATGLHRMPVEVFPATVRMLSLWYEQTFHRFPLSLFWLDYLASDRTCPVDTIPRMFGLMPARLSQQSGYLKSVPSPQKRRMQ